MGGRPVLSKYVHRSNLRGLTWKVRPSLVSQFGYDVYTTQRMVFTHRGPGGKRARVAFTLGDHDMALFLADALNKGFVKDVGGGV